MAAAQSKMHETQGLARGDLRICATHVCAQSRSASLAPQVLSALLRSGPPGGAAAAAASGGADRSCRHVAARALQNLSKCRQPAARRLMLVRVGLGVWLWKCVWSGGRRLRLLHANTV